MTEPKKDTRRWQTVLVMLMDAALACLSLVLALQIYYDMNPPETLEQIWHAMPLLAAVSEVLQENDVVIEGFDKWIP